MPINIIESDNGLGHIVTGRGIIKDSELVEASKKQLSLDEEIFKKYKYSLSDFTAAEIFEVSVESIKLIANWCNEKYIINPNLIVAIIANKDYIFGLMRMWEIMAHKSTWEKMIFRNRKNSDAWIREKVKEKYGIDDLTFK